MPTVNEITIDGYIENNPGDQIIIGDVSTLERASGSLSSGNRVSGESFLTSIVDGRIQNVQRISGDASVLVKAIGSLSNVNEISGESYLPTVLDSTAIHYNTTDVWNSMVGFISQKAHIYVYSDYTKREKEDGSVELIPAIKIGDGTSYLIDMPFVTSCDDESWIDHINNALIHVSKDDRTSWNNKVSATVIEPQEVLVLSF